jgi:enamine deaminase RidA (YjgF/YER057c/UK114 family)
VPVGDARAALCLATANALASARAAGDSLERLRCVVLVGFVSSAAPDGLHPDILRDSLALLASALPTGDRPAVWLRAAQGLAGGMPVEVELVLESRGRVTGEPRALSRRPRRHRKAGPAAARAPRRSGARTS